MEVEDSPGIVAEQPTPRPSSGLRRPDAGTGSASVKVFAIKLRDCYGRLISPDTRQHEGGDESQGRAPAEGHKGTERLVQGTEDQTRRQRCDPDSEVVPA